MRKFSIASVALCALLAASSCGTDNALTFIPVTFNETTALEEGAQDSIKISMEVAYPENTGDKRAQNISAAISATLFGSEYKDMAPQEAMKAWSDSLKAEYVSDNLELLAMMRENGEENLRPGMDWTCDKTGFAVGQFGNFLGYRTTTYMYTGGAHGGMNEVHLNFDSNSGNLLEQEDVFADGFESEVGKLLMKHLNDGRTEDEAISLLVDEISPNGNFSVGENGVTFIFNQYEIAAYAFGVIEITIPADEIKPFLKPGMNPYH